MLVQIELLSPVVEVEGPDLDSFKLGGKKQCLLGEGVGTVLKVLGELLVARLLKDEGVV